MKKQVLVFYNNLLSEFSNKNISINSLSNTLKPFYNIIEIKESDNDYIEADTQVDTKILLYIPKIYLNKKLNKKVLKIFIEELVLALYHEIIHIGQLMLLNEEEILKLKENYLNKKSNLFLEDNIHITKNSFIKYFLNLIFKGYKYANQRWMNIEQANYYSNIYEIEAYAFQSALEEICFNKNSIRKIYKKLLKDFPEKKLVYYLFNDKTDQFINLIIDE